MSSRYPRVDNYFSEMVIKPHSLIDEIGFDYEFTYFDNPQLRLSSTIVNLVTTAGKLSLVMSLHVHAYGQGCSYMYLKLKELQ